MRLALTLLALGATAAAAATPALSVVDDAGRTVHLDTPARRVVTLSPHATDLVVAAGGTASLVAVANGPAPAEVGAELPRIGGPGRLDRERLLLLRPDLVIAWQSGNRRADLDWIARRGTAMYLSEPRTLADIAAAIRAIGRLVGRPGHAERSAARFTAALTTDCRSLPQRPVYVALWDRPALSVGGRHWLNDVLRHAGYRNVLQPIDRGVVRVAAETLLSRQPLQRLSLVRRFDDSDEDQLADLLSRPGPGLADGVQRLCRQRLADRPR